MVELFDRDYGTTDGETTHILAGAALIAQHMQLFRESVTKKA